MEKIAHLCTPRYETQLDNDNHFYTHMEVYISEFEILQ